MFSLDWLRHLLETYGYVAIGLGVLLESAGLPLPGESLMIGAAIYAATTHKLNIFVLVPVAAIGAIAGDQLGYFIGRWIGFRVLARWGHKVGLTDERLQLGRFLFRKYGGRVVFFGRFVAVLRTVVALMAGANHMAWRQFLLWNALGGVGWTSLYGFGAYLLGDAAQRLNGWIGIGLGGLAALTLIGAFLLVKRNETQLLEQAKREMGQADRPRAAKV